MLRCSALGESPQTIQFGESMIIRKYEKDRPHRINILLRLHPKSGMWIRCSKINSLLLGFSPKFAGKFRVLNGIEVLTSKRQLKAGQHSTLAKSSRDSQHHSALVASWLLWTWKMYPRWTKICTFGARSTVQKQKSRPCWVSTPFGQLGQCAKQQQRRQQQQQEQQQQQKVYPLVN